VKTVQSVPEVPAVPPVNQVLQVNKVLEVQPVQLVKTVKTVQPVHEVPAVHEVHQVHPLLAKPQLVHKVKPAQPVQTVKTENAVNPVFPVPKVQPVPPVFQVSPDHQVFPVQPVNAVAKVQKVQPVFQVSLVLMVSTVLQAPQDNNLLHKPSVSSSLDTPKPTKTQAAHPVPFLSGPVTPFSTPLATTTTTLKTSDPLVLALKNSTPCQPPSAAVTKSADTPAETPNPTGLPPALLCQPWLSTPKTSDNTSPDATSAKLHPPSSLSTLKLLRSQNAQSVSTPCGWVTPSSLTPPKVLTVADKTWVVQVLASKISEPLHLSSAPVPEVLANSLLTVSVSGSEPSTPTNNSLIHNFKPLKVRWTVEAKFPGAKFASNLSK